jgi:hypothetical protein
MHAAHWDSRAGVPVDVSVIVWVKRAIDFTHEDWFVYTTSGNKNQITRIHAREHAANIPDRSPKGWGSRWIVMIRNAGRNIFSMS